MKTLNCKLRYTNPNHKELIKSFINTISNLPEYPIIYCTKLFYEDLKYIAKINYNEYNAYSKLLFLERIGRINLDNFKTMKDFVFFADCIFLLDEDKTIDLQGGFAFLNCTGNKILLKND